MVSTDSTEIGPVSARELAAATPDSRNRYVDLLRVGSIAVVVLGHWLMAVLAWRDGRFTGDNLLELDPDLQILTWAFQVMPIFFIVGGFTNGGSWASASRRGTTYAAWLRARGARLLRPGIVFVAFWTVLPVLAVAVGLPSSLARTGGEEVALPLWFLAIYLLTMAGVPPLLEAHRRLGGVRVLLGLAGAAALVDVLRWAIGVPVVSGLNYGLVWLAILEIGFLWRDGTLTRNRWIPWGMAGGGLAALVVLTTVGPYPFSMIGLTHAERSNTVPPSFALVALAVWQAGAMLLLEPAANRWLARARVWLVVVAGNGMVMTLYLWNMTALVLAAVLLFPTGIAPQPEPLGASWWWLRPAWILACALCLLPFLVAFRWAERPGSPPEPGSAGWAASVGSVVGVTAAGAGMAVLAAVAFPVQGETVLIPAIGVALVGAGAILLRANPRARARAPVPAPG